MENEPAQIDELSAEEKMDLLSEIKPKASRREYYNQWAKYYLGLREQPPESPNALFN